MSGLELVLNVLRAWTPAFLVSAVASLSFLSHFDRITKGVLDLPGTRLLPVADRLCAVCQPHHSSSSRKPTEEEQSWLAFSSGRRELYRTGADWLVARCARLPRHTLAWGSIALALILLLSVNLFASSALRDAQGST